MLISIIVLAAPVSMIVGAVWTEVAMRRQRRARAVLGKNLNRAIGLFWED